MKLKNLGLTEYEAKVYEELLKGERLSGKELGERTKVPPTAVYPTTKTLVKKNLIQEFSGERKEFQALPPKLAIPAFLERKKKELIQIEQETLQDIELLKQEKSFTPQKD